MSGGLQPLKLCRLASAAKANSRLSLTGGAKSPALAQTQTSLCFVILIRKSQAPVAQAANVARSRPLLSAAAAKGRESRLLQFS
jgi:hypothetical protein